jgi:hypothetical protein
MINTTSNDDDREGLCDQTRSPNGVRAERNLELDKESLCELEATLQLVVFLLSVCAAGSWDILTEFSHSVQVNISIVPPMGHNRLLPDAHFLMFTFVYRHA